MSKTTQWLPALVMLGAGFLGGYLFGSAEAPSGGAGGDELTADPDASGGTADAAALTAEGVHPTLETGGDPHGLTAVLERIPPPQVPTGDGRITGRVTDEAGTGIAGARVVARPQMPASLGARRAQDRESESLADLVTRTVAVRRWMDAARTETTSGADGRFELGGLSDTEHDVRVTHDDFQIRAKDRRTARRVEPGADLLYTGTAQVAVTIEVYLPDGSEPKDADISFSGGSHSRGMGWRPDHKTLRIPPGSYQATARGGDGGSYKSPAQSVQLEVGTPLSLTFHLEGAPMVRGTLEYAEGQALEKCVVRLVRLAPGVKADPALLRSSENTEWVRRRRHGTHDFTFRDISPGRYLVGASRSHNGAILVMETVDVGRGPADVALKLPALERDEYVVVTVLGPDGKIIPNVQASTGYQSTTGSSMGGGTYLRRPGGVLWVLHCDAGIRGAGADAVYSIEVTAGGHGKMRKTYKRGAVGELTFRFEKAAEVRVSVSGLVGTRYEGRLSLRVNAADVNEMHRTHIGEQIQLDEKGEGAVSGLQPGSYTLTGSLGGRRGMGSPIFDQAFEVTARGATVRVSMPVLHVVTVLGAEGHCWIQKKNGRGHRMAQAGKDGRAIIDGIPAGTYTARSGKKSKEFTVPGTSEVDLR